MSSTQTEMESCRPLKRLFGSSDNLLDVILLDASRSKVPKGNQPIDQHVYSVTGHTANKGHGLVNNIDEEVQTETNFKTSYTAVFQGICKLRDTDHMGLDHWAMPPL